MPRRLLTLAQMNDPAIRKKHNVSPGAFARFQADAALVSAKVLVSPVASFQFVWDPETGERWLFHGQIDPP